MQTRCLLRSRLIFATTFIRKIGFVTRWLPVRSWSAPFRFDSTPFRFSVSYVIGIDIGGTRLKVGAVDRSGRVVRQAVVPSLAERGAHSLFRAVREQVRQFERAMGAAPAAIGLGMSGAVDPKRGVVMLPGKFKGLEGFPIVSKLSQATRVPVVADNDARLAMIAERTYGSARRHDWAVMVTIGTGLGSGVVLDGKILRDPHLQFGTQLGHIVIQALGGRLCLTNARGTAEMLCSATALASAVRDGLQRGMPSILADRYWGDAHSIDFAAVIEGVEKKDRLCLDELNHWRQNLGWLLVGAVHAYAPQIIILGGGGANVAKHFLPALRKQVNAHLFRHPVGQKVPIVVSKLTDHAGVLGAAAVAWHLVKR
jgi:glucokinase